MNDSSRIEFAKRYLQQVEVLETKINSQTEEIERLKLLLTKVTPSLKQDAGGGSNSDDKMCISIAKIIDLREELNTNIMLYAELKQEIFRKLEFIKKEDQYQVLYKRYFEFKKFEQIACEMVMTYRNVNYIHKRALRNFAKINENSIRKEESE